MNRDSDSDYWSADNCIKVTVGNPYENKSLYSTFVNDIEDEKLSCVVSKSIFIMGKFILELYSF